MAEENDVSHPLKVRWNSTHSGVSLFRRIPDRHCSSAGVPGKFEIVTVLYVFKLFPLDKFCPCSRAKPIENTSGIVRYLTSHTINFINDVLLKNHSHLCHQLNLKQIIRAEWETRSSLNESDVYVVLFEVSPSNGIFESRLLHHAPTNQTEIQGEILRVNLYGESSKCIQDRYSLRSFCYCFTTKNSTSSNIKSSQSPVRWWNFQWNGTNKFVLFFFHRWRWAIFRAFIMDQSIEQLLLWSVLNQHLVQRVHSVRFHCE